MRVEHCGPDPRELTAEEDAQRIQGLRLLARMIAHSLLAGDQQVLASDDDEGDAPSEQSPEGEAA